MASMKTTRFGTNQAARKFADKWKDDHGGYFIRRCDLPCPVRSAAPSVRHRKQLAAGGNGRAIEVDE